MAVTTDLAIYRTQVLPEWVDYNGHLRDAYYVLVASYAADASWSISALMRPTGSVRIALSTRSSCMSTTSRGEAGGSSRGHCAHHRADSKRIHAGFDVGCARLTEPAASIELMLLHVEQGESVKPLPFPPRSHALWRLASCNRRRRARETQLAKNGAARR